MPVPWKGLGPVSEWAELVGWVTDVALRQDTCALRSAPMGQGAGAG